jgi:hypothetical protein
MSRYVDGDWGRILLGTHFASVVSRSSVESILGDWDIIRHKPKQQSYAVAQDDKVITRKKDVMRDIFGISQSSQYCESHSSFVLFNFPLALPWGTVKRVWLSSEAMTPEIRPAIDTITVN